MLTDVKLRNLKKPGKHFDGAGLYRLHGCRRR